MLISTTNRNHDSGRGVEEYLMWGPVADALARTVVEPVFRSAELLGREGGEVECLREVLAQESIHILDSAALPRCIRLGEVHRSLQERGEGAHRGGQRSQAACHRRCRHGRRFVAQSAKTYKTRLALDEGQDAGAPTLSGKRVAFPVTETPVPCHDGGTFGELDPTGNGAAHAAGLAVALAPDLLATQVPVEISALAFVLKQVLVNPFGAYAKRTFLGNPSGNLFRTPVLPHQTVDLGPVPCCQHTTDLARAPGQCEEMGVSRPVAARGPIAVQFARDGGLVYANDACDHTLVVPGLTQGGNLVSLLTGELVIGFHQGSIDLAVEAPGATPAHPHTRIKVALGN